MANEQENITGASLTGVSGATNRTYALANADAIANTLLVLVDNSVLHPTSQYTFAGNTIVFLNEVWDDSKITLSYQTLVTGATPGTYYCLPADVQRKLLTTVAFSSTTVPSETQVYSNIEDSMTDIDKLTGHAWRERTVTDEYYDVPDNFRYVLGTGLRLKLNHRAVKTFSTAAGDKLEVWDGNSWVDWVSTKTEGRNNDYWLDGTNGVLYLQQAFWYQREAVIRLTYRYGETAVPNDIREACALLVAADIVMNSQFSTVVKQGADGKNSSNQTRAEYFERRAGLILDKYKEWSAF